MAVARDTNNATKATTQTRASSDDWTGRDEDKGVPP
jgi:hypothetical protein